MSINYGDMAAGVPGNAGGVGFRPWTGQHLVPNTELHNASLGVPAAVQRSITAAQGGAPTTSAGGSVLHDPTLGSRTPTNPTPGPISSQVSTFSNLPSSIQKALQDLSIDALQSQSNRAAMLDKIMGIGGPQQPIISSAAPAQGFDMNAYLQKMNAQRAAQAQAWNSMRPNYNSMAGVPTAPAPMNPLGASYEQPRSVATPPVPTIGRQLLNSNMASSTALPQY